MGRATQRRDTVGLSLVELLVVLGMIGVISAVVVPAYIRSGWSGAGKSAFAARELFTILKAARVYASTYNVETAVAYGGAMAKDSELVLDGTITNPCVPFADSVIFARRLKREEMIELNVRNLELGIALNLPIDATNVFIPLSTTDGAFRKIPKDMAILPDLFAVAPSGSGFVSQTGLTSIRLYNVDGPNADIIADPDDRFLSPRSDNCTDSPTEGQRLDYLMAAQTRSFPSHRFLPDGSIRAPEGVQRFRFRVGARPDATYKDRFFTNSNTDLLRAETRPLYFNVDNATPTELRPVTVGLDGDSDTYDYADIATTIELFVPTGRVRMLP